MQVDFATPVSSTALPQFLRGIGKRGYVLAEAQCGDSARAQQALSASIEEFRDAAQHLSLAQWPEQFWQRLLAQPALRIFTPSRNQHEPLLHLSNGPRAALLLRLVAGLDTTHGAAVLRVSPPAYRHALSRALQVLHAQGIDEAALHALREHLQQRVRELPEQFLQTSASEWAPQPAAPGTARSTLVRRHRLPRRWLRRTLSIALGMLLLLFAATYIQRPSRPLLAGRSEHLPEQAVAARLSSAAAAVASPDFDLLNDPDGERTARDLPLLSWYDAAAAVPTSDSAPVALPESTLPETSNPDPATPADQHGEGGPTGAP